MFQRQFFQVGKLYIPPNQTCICLTHSIYAKCENGCVQWRTQKIPEGGGGVMPPGKFCKLTPKNTHICAFWKQVLDNPVFTFFIFRV